MSLRKVQRTGIGRSYLWGSNISGWTVGADVTLPFWYLSSLINCQNFALRLVTVVHGEREFLGPILRDDRGLRVSPRRLLDRK